MVGPLDGGMGMNVGQLTGGRLVKVGRNASLSEVARLMTREQVGAVVVTESSAARAPLAGIITDRDIVNAQLDQAKDLSSISAEAVMTRNVLTLAPEESIDGAIAHMRARGVRRAPVMSADGVPVGLISTDDLISQVSSELLGIATIVTQQSGRSIGT